MEVNYRWKKHYKTAKYPIRQPLWLTWVIWILSKICLVGKKYTLETVNTENLKPPYIIFSNHMAFIRRCGTNCRASRNYQRFPVWLLPQEAPSLHPSRWVTGAPLRTLCPNVAPHSPSPSHRAAQARTEQDRSGETELLARGRDL